jgi:alkane 1-monooxygenase
MKKWKYLFVYTTPAIVLFSILVGNLYSYAAVVLLFGILPLLELFTTGSTENFSKEEEEKLNKDRFYDVVLYSLVPIQYLILGAFLYTLYNSSLELYELIGIILAYGMSAGVLGINAAHELGHRNTKYEQTMSKLLLLTSLYMHFFIEHNRGHHRNVSTDEDPASARFGESVYAFYFRSTWGSWFSAWQLEKERLKRENTSFWSIHNEMLRFQLIQLSLLIAIGLLFNLFTLFGFILGATIGFLLLETVNYIEHYGLRRKKKNNGYERTLPIHSWNSNHPIGRLLLLELSRHSDHHYIASRKYPILRHFDESPQMPTGYPGMMLLALVPPLWFRLMHRKINTYRTMKDGASLA